MNERPDPAAIQSVFGDIPGHRAIAGIIRSHSTNSRDVRHYALEGLDLSKCGDILELGCAFGPFTETLQGRVSPAGVVVGVDIVEAYDEPFLDACRRAGLRGRFLAEGVPVVRSFPEASFDLVLCSFALYFFPEVIPEVARILRPGGLFVVITHDRNNMGELADLIREILAREGDLPEGRLPVEAIVARFSAENGEALLAPWFGRIDALDYRNTLVFPSSDIPQILRYIRFKSPFLLTGTSRTVPDLILLLERELHQWIRNAGSIRLSKNDRIFRCRLPQPRKDGA
ncbi:MAG: methyltransferase domain-containing protein [Syntrophaceae bacterium]|nr:methyltransferase domain-containing protein [Syntrophaceae bacterium]